MNMMVERKKFLVHKKKLDLHAKNVVYYVTDKKRL